MKVTFALIFFIGLCLAADPDQFRNARELISSKGYPVEEHYVTTADGYILYVLRIPHGLNGTHGKKPVILQHGVLDSCDTWLLNLANESLAFILADAGYDVWLGNSRGNKYSRGHTTLDPNSLAYWRFSWDDMAHYDVTGVIQYVTGKTGYSKVAFVGHSQGTTQMFANLATTQTVASKLDIFIALAPVAYVYNTKSILLKAIAEIDLDKLISFFDDKAFLPSTAFLKWLLPDLCKATPPLCDSVLYLIAGDNFKYINQSRWDVIVSHFPSGTSTKDMCHWAQGVREDKFRMYDYGLIGNEEKYHQSTPPRYNLSSINNVPIALLYGGQDDLADTTDVKRLISELPALNIVKVQYYPTAGHCEFVWAPGAATTIYPLVIDLLG